MIDATGLNILPGALDLHTHLTGSNPDPEGECEAGTLDGFEKKRAMMARTTCIDHALWAGLDNANLGILADLDAAGAIAFKAFLTSGDPTGAAPDKKGLPKADDGFLLAAMKVIAGFDGLVGIHSENHEILSAARTRLMAEGRRDIRAHAESAPEIAEIEAVGRVIAFASETGTRTHVVHVSSARAARIIAAARPEARITFESCSHYLTLDEDDLVRIGADARCGPPLRPRTTVDALMDLLMAEQMTPSPRTIAPTPWPPSASGMTTSGKLAWD